MKILLQSKIKFTEKMLHDLKIRLKSLIYIARIEEILSSCLFFYLNVPQLKICYAFRLYP